MRRERKRWTAERGDRDDDQRDGRAATDVLSGASETTEAEREMHRDTVEKYNTLIDKLVGKDEEIERTMREKEKELHQNAETQTKLQQKDDEIVKLRQKSGKSARN